MSGKINGNGGFGEILRRVRAGGTGPTEASTPSTGTQAKVSGDQNLIGSGAASRLSLSANLPEVAPSSARDMVLKAKNLNELVQNIVRNEFPGLKLSAGEAAKMAMHIRSGLEAKGITDQSFGETQKNLG